MSKSISSLISADFPTFLVDSRAQVMECDDAARHFFEDGVLGARVAGKFTLSRGAARAVQEAIASLDRVHAPTRKAVAFGGGSNGDASSVQWLIVENCAADMHGTYVISVRDLANFNPYNESLLVHSLGFTPSEASVAISLALGESVKDYAHRTARSIATVRWHLSNALSKAQCRSQSELVRLLLLLSI